MTGGRNGKGGGKQAKLGWQNDNATGRLASYSPTGPAELNDLTSVSSGVIVWIQLTEQTEFQGRTLNAGWQIITLE